MRAQGSPGWFRHVWIGLLGGAAALAGVVLVVAGLKPPPLNAAPAAMQPAAVLKTDKLLITIGLVNDDNQKLRGQLAIELVGPDGKILAADRQNVEQNDAVAAYKFELKAPKSLDNVALHFQYGKEEKFTVPLQDILVAKAHETSVSAGQEFHSGSLATLRCGIHSVKSLTETIPLIGDVEIRLKNAKGEETSLYKGRTNKQGIADAQFKVPAVPPGQYTLVVATKSDLAEEKLEQPIKVKSEPKILLTTDKPLYQPGQQMHIRALVLRPFDLTPEANANLVFEVEDAKGNKVFKKAEKTSEYGIVAVDFQLADEVNMGDYQIRAILDKETAQKTVTVKKYVLPKFKTEVKADKKFYMPGETVQLEVQSDYFFGKPVAQGKVKVEASTFDVQFHKFQELNGTTDANGHTKFEIKLPNAFAGQPLQKGDAIVKLEVKLTDTADHTETITKTYPVSDKAIRVSLIPEAGRLVPGLENRVFAAAIYPDGSPAKCDVNLWLGTRPDGKAWASVKTNDAGLAEFQLTPKAEQFRQGPWEQKNLEMLGGQVIPINSQQLLFDLSVEAKDAKGGVARSTAALNGDALGDNVLLRLDKAIYKGGETLNAEVRTSAGLPTAYLDIVRAGQTMLTRWMDVKDGKATHSVDLPANIFGTLEIHAYQMLASGEIVRDSRVVYVHPRDDLKIAVQADKDVYLPGQKGEIRFTVTDSQGKPAPAALGVIIVDEAVYALQDMQPGLEKVYFTLQEELTKAQAQAVFKPSETIDVLIRAPEVADPKQQIAQALLATVKPKLPQRWEVAPAMQRRQEMDARVQQVGFTLFNYAQQQKPVMEQKDGKWVFRADLQKELVQAKMLDASLLLDPLGNKLTLADMAKAEPGFTPNALAQAITMQRLQQLGWAVVNYTNNQRAKFFKNGEWTIPENILADAAKQQGLGAEWLKDGWGNPLRVQKRTEKLASPTGHQQLDQYEVVSAGPDGKFGTADDVKPWPLNDWQRWNMLAWWWLADPMKGNARLAGAGRLQQRMFQLRRGAMMKGEGGGRGGFRGDDAANLAMPMAAQAAPGGFGGPVMENKRLAAADGKPMEARAKDQAGQTGGAGGPPAMRIREYFPETLLWRPSLITDDKGVARLPLDFADSITTWRLSASANSRGGALGGVSSPLRVFQDFFVDLDLPVSLTQNDEVAFPVAVYNYLKTPQTVKIDLQPEPWFEMVDSDGMSRSLALNPNEVTSIKFRIRAKKVGFQPLTVKAAGSKMSDAIKRVIEIVPDGQKVEQVVTDRLEGPVKQVINIPENSVPDASKIIVKVYPGVMAQVLEGVEGLLRLPGG